MTSQRFPELDPAAIRETRDALHAYAGVLGGWLKTSRTPRKHWWHESLRPSLRGLTTGVVRAGVEFEVELDFAASRLVVRTTDVEAIVELEGQSARSIASGLDETLAAAGVDMRLAPGDEVRGDREFSGYEATQAAALQGALGSVCAAFEEFRAGIREETSPIQLWPHHFDLAMIWLPGTKIPGQDPSDAANADKQMNFGFLFGDDGIGEPYFYVTAYPLPEALPGIALPKGATWHSDGFSGAVFLYRDLPGMSEPSAYLEQFWSTLLAAGRIHLATED